MYANEIRLTRGEWKVVEEQCSKCKLWDNREGCMFDAGKSTHDPYPVQECNMFEEKRRAYVPLS